jgi:hypothetical protein
LCVVKQKNYKKKLMGLKIKILSKTELNRMPKSIAQKLAAAAASSAATAVSTSARPATDSISSGSEAPKPPAVPLTEECKAFKEGSRCKFVSGCRDPRCKAEQAKSAKSSAPAKAAAAGGGGDVAKLRKEVADLTGLVKAGFEKQSEQTSTLSDTVVAGFAAQKEADDRLQRSIEAMMGGIGGLARAIEGGITSRRSFPELPVPSVSSKKRATLALPAPEEFDSKSSDSDSESALENFERVAILLRECPLNSAVILLIRSFVVKYPSFNSDALACMILGFLSGKKLSDFKKMGEFTRNKVMPLLTEANHKIFQHFFAKLAPKCKPDSCVSVKNAKGTTVSHTFHILGKEDGAILHIIRILREEE